MWRIIRRWFSGLLRSFWSLMKQIFSGATEIILAELKDVALASVRRLAKTDLSNEEKRKQAFKDIKAYAKRNGIRARDSIVNLAIELAVQALKKGIQK